MAATTMAAAAFVVESIVIIAYWAMYFSMAPPFKMAWYSVYENSFPIADMVVVLNCCMYLFHFYSKTSRASKPLALVHGLVAVGGTLFLGCIDITFDVQNGMYQYMVNGTFPQKVNMAVEVGINIWCVLIPLWLMHFMARNMHLYTGSGAPQEQDTTTGPGIHRKRMYVML